jgi:hypothetical protein
MKRFTFWRNAIIGETYVVEAATEEEALEMLFNGNCDPVDSEWIDWATDNYELEHTEIIDPLYKMVKEHKCDTTS